MKKIHPALKKTGAVNLLLSLGRLILLWVQRLADDINPLFPNAPFLYPLKISENLTVF